MYPDLHTKAAALLGSSARNHALIDGNERLAWVTTRLLLILNDDDVRVPSPEVGDEFVRDVAQGHLTVAHIAETLVDWRSQRQAVVLDGSQVTSVPSCPATLRRGAGALYPRNGSCLVEYRLALQSS